MKQFFFFGDSITLGVSDPKDNGWVGHLIAMAIDNPSLPVPPTTFYNLGVRKNSSREIYGRWFAEFNSRQFPSARNFLIFCFGTVDTAFIKGDPNVCNDESIAHARWILSGAKESGPVLLMSAPPVTNKEHSERISTLMLGYARLCTELHIPFLDIFTPLSAKQSYLNSLKDGIHPTAEGNSIIAGMLLNSPVMQKWINEE